MAALMGRNLQPGSCRTKSAPKPHLAKWLNTRGAHHEALRLADQLCGSSSVGSLH